LHSCLTPGEKKKEGAEGGGRFPPDGGSSKEERHQKAGEGCHTFSRCLKEKKGGKNERAPAEKKKNLRATGRERTLFFFSLGEDEEKKKDKTGGKGKEISPPFLSN